MPCPHDTIALGIDRRSCADCGEVLVTRADIDARLQVLGEHVRAANPTLTIVVDDLGVWVRHAGTDYAIYATAFDLQIVDVWQVGVSTVHRPAPVG